MARTRSGQRRVSSTERVSLRRVRGGSRAAPFPPARFRVEREATRSRLRDRRCDPRLQTTRWLTRHSSLATVNREAAGVERCQHRRRGKRSSSLAERQEPAFPLASATPRAGRLFALGTRCAPFCDPDSLVRRLQERMISSILFIMGSTVGEKTHSDSGSCGPSCALPFPSRSHAC